MDTISLNEVITRIDQGKTFDFAFVTANKKKGTGGEWIALENVCKHNYLTAEERLSRIHSKSPVRKDPRHYPNSTRNIRIMTNGNIVKVHLRLIRRFNGKVVR
jgi:hypothetical protein